MNRTFGRVAGWLKQNDTRGVDARPAAPGWKGAKFVGMALKACGYELVGASVVGAGPITDITHVELNEGLTVLYGLNGAGKSYLLRALSDTLTGRGSKEYLDLHVRLRGSSKEVGSLVKQIDAALTFAVNKERVSSAISMGPA